MTFTSKQIKQLAEIVKNANALLEQALNGVPAKTATTRKRRTGRELIQFKKMIKAERRNGATAAMLAKKYGVSQNYIYQL